MSPIDKATASKPAQGVSYYTPAQEPPVGTALDLDSDNQHKVPTLFRSLTIRSITLTNRFVVSPMCQYSADDGHLTDWHLIHLGAMSARGAALTIVEATAVQANGRISPEDSALWKDSQIAPLRRVVEFVHSQGQHVGIQLSHAGRKASTLAPWHGQRGKSHVAGEDVGGWPNNVLGPSAIPFSETFPRVREMTLEQVRELIRAFASAARRAVEAGFDVIEIHGAHGYLLTEFMSPLSNQRSDEYGGSFENRIRLTLDVIKAIRDVIPDTMPLFLRISATEWMEWSGKESWDLPQSIELAHRLPELGVDLLDVSSGGNANEQKIEIHPYYQVDLAGEIRASLRKAGKQMLIGAVGMITTAEMARDIVQSTSLPDSGKEPSEQEDQSKADVVVIARQFLREPEFVLRTARHLGVKVKWPNQYLRAE